MKKRIAFLIIALTLLLAFTSCDVIDGLVNNQNQPNTEHEHVFGEWETKTPASCTEAGEEFRVCDCGEEETRAIEALGHNYEAVVTDPTCTEVGYTTYTCACGDSYVGDEVASTGHSFDAVVTAPTCTEAGYTTYTCVCGHSTVVVDTNPTGHNMVATADETHHWSACANSGCSEATEKMPHDVKSIAVSYFEEDMMENKVLTADDFIVTGICTCGKEFAVTEGIEIISGTLVLGDNVVTVKVGDVSMDVTIYARPFSVAIGGNVNEDTYVYSDKASQEKNYSTQPELSTNGDNFRVLLKYNFSDVINNVYYNDHKGEAKIEFVFTMTTGTIDENTKLTFKAYPVDEVRSGADFSALTWKNYDATYGFGWGKADGFVNKEAGNPRVTISDNTIIITLAYREIEKYVDANGDAFFVFAIWKSGTKIGSVDNENESVRPRWTVHFSNEHIHAFVEEIVDEKYLASANCGETAKYYKSCSCGEAGADIFNHGEIIGHSFGEFVETTAPTCTTEGVNTKTCDKCGATETESIPVISHNYDADVTAPTCTVAGFTTYTCICGDSYVSDEVAATGHTYGEWLHDESYHWVACNCGDIANKSTHAGGEATETEQAVCDTCKQPYGGLASHVHNYSTQVTPPTCTDAGFTTYTCDCGDVYVGNTVVATGHTYGEWETVYPATCEGDELLVHYCDCGASEASKGALAFGHDMQTKYDENNHWTECAHNCGLSTDPVAHFGGEATETEQAICEGCGEAYGELKPAEKKQCTIAGAIVEDTYVASDSGTAKKTDYSTSKNTLGIGSKYYRAYFKFNISDAISSEDFDPISTDAKIQFVFTLSKGALDSTTEFTLGFFTPAAGVTDVAFSNIYWNNISSTTALYPQLKWDNATNLLDGVANSEHVEIDGSTVTVTFNYSQLADYVDANGNILLTLRTSTTGVSIASMENTTYAIPAIKYVYYK